MNVVIKITLEECFESVRDDWIECAHGLNVWKGLGKRYRSPPFTVTWFGTSTIELMAIYSIVDWSSSDLGEISIVSGSYRSSFLRKLFFSSVHQSQWRGALNLKGFSEPVWLRNRIQKVINQYEAKNSMFTRINRSILDQFPHAPICLYPLTFDNYSSPLLMTRMQAQLHGRPAL